MAGVKPQQIFSVPNVGLEGFEIKADSIGLCWMEIIAVIAV